MGIAAKKTTTTRAKPAAKPKAQRTAAEIAAEILDDETLEDAAAAVAAEADADVTAEDVQADVDAAVTAAVEEAVDEIVAEIEADEGGDDEGDAPDEGARAKKGQRSLTNRVTQIPGTRAAQIVRLCTRNGLSPEFAASHIEAGTSLSVLREAIVTARMSRSVAPASSVSVRITRDEGDTLRTQASNAFYAKLSNIRTKDSNLGPFANDSLVGMYRRLAGASGNGRSDQEVVKMMMRSGMHSTSDFGHMDPSVAAVERRIRDYTQNPNIALMPIVRETTLPNDLPVPTYSVGNFPELLETKEGAEYQDGSIITESGTIRVVKFGRVFSVSEESLIRDDLRLLNTAIQGAASQYINLKKKVIREAFIGKMIDGLPVFHTKRGNLINDVIGIDGLAKAQVLLSMVPDLNGEPMDLELVNIIASPLDRLAWDRLVSPITAAVTGDVNTFAGRFNVIYDSMMKKGEWIATADPAYGDAIELADMAGYSGLQVEEAFNPRVDGFSYRARAFVGSAPTGWRGFVKSTGTGA